MEINILIDEGFTERLDADWLERIVKGVFITEGASADAEVSLAITSQERVRELNQTKHLCDLILSSFNIPSFRLLHNSKQRNAG